MSTSGSLASRFRRLERISLAIALVWATGLVIAAALVPAYQTASASSSGTVTDGSATMVAVNGWGVLLVAGAPLAATLLIWYGLWRRRGREGAGVLAWLIAGLLACFTLLAMLSMGVFILPVPIALVVACATHGSKPHGVITRSDVPN